MKVSILSIKAGTKFRFPKNTVITDMAHGQMINSDGVAGPFKATRVYRSGYIYFENVSGDKFRVYFLNVNVEID